MISGVLWSISGILGAIMILIVVGKVNQKADKKQVRKEIVYIIGIWIIAICILILCKRR